MGVSDVTPPNALPPLQGGFNNGQPGFQTPVSSLDQAPASSRGAYDFWNVLKAQNPWLDQIGFDLSWIQGVLARTGNNPDAILMEVRADERYRARFPGLWREDGSLRMNEAQYIAQEDTYRQLLRQHGISEEAYKTPSDVAGFFDNEIDPNELAQRLGTYVQIRDGSQAVRDAFYAYAGLDISVDELFEATVDERLAASLSDSYRERASQADYDSFIGRVTELARGRIQYANGVITADGSRQLLDAIYTNGGAELPGAGQPLSLQELLASYEEATIGAAAASAGLGLPDKDRIAQIRAAGVTRARAQEQYLQFGLQRGSLSGNAERAGLGTIDRTKFEDAAFFGNADAARSLQTAEAYGRAVGQQGGSFRFDQDQAGGIYQRGLRT